MVESSLGRPDGYLVYYIELRGSFAVAAPPSGPTDRGSSLVFHRAMIVLDAQTGNILLSGQVPFSPSSMQPSASSGAGS
jgi:hypothetical protein